MEGATDPGDNPGCEQGVAAKVEKVVVNADSLEPEHIAED
jgi:hypothetical protein